MALVVHILVLRAIFTICDEMRKNKQILQIHSGLLAAIANGDRVEEIDNKAEAARNSLRRAKQ